MRTIWTLTIKKRLIVSAGIAILAIVALGGLLLKFSADIREELRKTRIANQLVKKTTDLLLITDEYLTYRYERYEQQWHTLFNSIVLLSNSYPDPGIAASVQQELHALHAYFQKLKDEIALQQNYRERNVPESDLERTAILEERLTAQIRFSSQKILALMFEIATEAEQNIRVSQSNGNTILLLFTGFLILIISLTSFVTIRHITVPLSILVRCAHHIKDGDFEINLQDAVVYSHDEIGELAAAFHKMNRHLIESLQHLDLEVRERKRAEEEIRALNADLEERVARRTAALEAVNKELRDFTYVASHDLKTPLRGISRIACWLKIDYAAVLDARGQEMADLLIGRVKRMDKQLDDILEYSKIGRISEKKKPIHLGTLLSDVVDSLAPPEHIHIRINDKLPVITAGRSYLFQVFQNLLENAIKYMDKPEGTILIGCKDADEYWQFSVSDNGPGIEEQYYNRIFNIFQTLVSKDEYDSTGMGLAIVKKIVEFYGGKIWLESETGKGSTFRFIFPKNCNR